MSLFAFVLLFVGLLVGVWLVFQLLVGAGILLAVPFWLAKVLFKTAANSAYGKVAPEIAGPLLTDEFKANAKGKMAPDMWTNGRRLFFEVGSTSYSVPPDLEAARKRKNELLAQHSLYR